MLILDRIQQVTARVAEYPWWEVAFEFAVIWLVVLIVFRFLRGTRAAGALKGLLFILMISSVLVLGVGGLFDRFDRLKFMFDAFLGLAAIVLVVTFQPELRRAFIRLGEASFLGGTTADRSTTVEAIVDACAFMSKNKFGAIIAIERNVGLREAIETGRPINGDISAHLLNAIFWPNSPLHDMGVVVRGNTIVAAGVPFPLVEPYELPDHNLGTRHRAAMGLARNSDALVVVVSEETGAISLAEGRKLTRWLTADLLRDELTKRLTSGEDEAPMVEDAAPDVAQQAKQDAGQDAGQEPAQDESKSKADAPKQAEAS